MKKSKDKMQELVINKYNLIKDERDKSNAFW
ncbi:Uncharacterised protein [Mycoplasmopsis columbina]|nr:Uncharacterised protein [Mycoplasmopsis columbina]